MPHQFHVISYRNHRPDQAGMTLLELLVVMLALSILAGAAMSLFGTTGKYRLEAASRNALMEQANEITRAFQEDLLYAGTGTAPGEKKAKLLFKADGGGGALKKPVPAAFVTQAGDAACLLQTTPDGTGLVVAATDGEHTVINGVDPDEWTILAPGSLLLFNNPGGTVSLLELVRAPRRALEADLPAAEPGSVELTVVADLRVVEQCGQMTPLATTIETGALVTPVIGLVRYRLEPGNGLVREQFNHCETEVPINQKVLLAPLFCEQASFAYRTAEGETTVLPSDLAKLQGIVAHLRLRDEKANQVRVLNLDITPFGWR